MSHGPKRRYGYRVLAGCVCAALLFCAPTAAAAGDDMLYFYDMTDLNALDLTDPAQARRAWDAAHLVASLQGLVNRDAPRLFVRFLPDPDDFWFAHLREEGEWLAGRPLRRIESLEEALRTFRAYYTGFVVYDEAVPATSNLASTIAGVEDRLCLRHDSAEDSLYRRVTAMDLGVTDVLRLFHDDGSPWFTARGTIHGTDLPSTGSAKCDAYLWACARYLDTGRCSREHMAYYIDTYWFTDPAAAGLSNATLSNHDFYIARRAFFFDLHVWDEEAPVDDPGQTPGTDARVLRRILRAMHDQARGEVFSIGGFVPWIWKYTSHGRAGSAHHPVDSEWKYAQIISSYNGIMDADALGYSGMANASFYTHFPLADRYPQNPRPTPEDLRARGFILNDGAVAPFTYILFYMGDYDASAWLQRHVPLWWNDPAHGDVLCTWAFNPNLIARAPHAMHYARSRQTPNDWFMAGDSGAGYLNPGMLLTPRPDPELEDGLDAWVRHNIPYYRRFDLSVTGFVIDGHAPGMGERGMDAYLQFSPGGIVAQKIPQQGLHRGVMPYIRMRTDLDGPPESAGAQIAGLVSVNRPSFAVVRTILKSPSYHRDVMAHAHAAPGGDALRFVDPYTFFQLLAAHERSKAEGRHLPEPRDTAAFTAPDRADGVGPVAAADGPFVRAEFQGRPVIAQPPAEAVTYLYFQTEDGLAQALQRRPGRTVRVAATLYDAAPGRIGLQFDSHGGGAYADAGAQSLSGSGEWVDLVFALPDARFDHSQNSAADFRLVNFNVDIRLHKMVVAIVPEN